MDNIKELAKIWTCVYSSSIANWHDKLDKRLGLERGWRMNEPVIFIGLYHWVDYLKFIFARGEKKVFWCGSDVVSLQDSWWRYIVANQDAEHFCENYVESDLLYQTLGIEATVIPMIFDDPSKYQNSYKHSDTPRVFATYHKGREYEYGWFYHPQVDWFCDLTEDEFNEKIKSYQGCVRLNKFDGFAESLAKSVLLGQYQWSEIPYPDMKTTQTLYQWIEDLKNKTVSNPASEVWRARLEESKQILLS